MSTADDDLLKEIRDRFAYATAEWRDIREEAKTDMRYVSGDPWDSTDRKQRKEAGRPCLSLDELGQYFNQTINDIRANPRAIKYTANGNGATDQSALFYANKTREIEYRSKAQIAYTTAFQDCVHRSYGFCRVNTQFASTRSFDQDLLIEPFVNPDMVTPDPDILMPSGSDMRYCFVHESHDTDDFKEEFPDAKIVNFSADMMRLAPGWVNKSRIQIAEYWKVKARKRKLLLLKPPPVQPPSGAMLGLRADAPQQPIAIFADELGDIKPSSEEILREREVDDQEVWQYVTNGVEILKRTKWKGKYIPIACCFGMILYSDEGSGSKKKILSMTRLARDPYMLYCYYRTCEAELVGMTPKFPYFAYTGQLSPDELLNLQKSLHEPVAVIQVKPVLDAAGVNVLPFPARQPYEPPLAGLGLGAESARRAIQAAMGVSPLPTQALRHNEKSGVALKQIEQAQQRGSFHFNDHYNGMVEHVGVILEDLMDKIYDTAREVGIRKPNDTAEMVAINGPGTRDQPAVSTKGDHLVTVSTGPSFDSEREVASDFADAIIGNPELLQMAGPQRAPKIISRAIKLKNLGAVGDEMADIFSPPEPKDGEPPTPEMLQQALEQAKGKVQELEQLAQQMKHDIDTDQAKQQAQLQMKAQEIDFQKWKVLHDSETKIAVAELGAKVDRLQLFLDERKRLGLLDDAAVTRAHDASQADHDRAHELGMQAQDHENTLEAGAQAHDQALEQGDQATAGQMAVQAAAPQPEAGA